MYVCVGVYTLTYIHIYIHPSIHTYIYTYMVGLLCGSHKITVAKREGDELRGREVGNGAIETAGG
jgi:hypothetical protein